MEISEEMVNEFLFGNGLIVRNYRIERTAISEILCYRNAEGREFDLPISDEALAAAVHERLKALNVRVVDL